MRSNTQKEISKLLIVLILCQCLIQPSYSYNYNSNGSDWDGLCITGTQQSPIDISDVQGSCDNTFLNETISTTITKDNQDLRSSTPANKYWSYLYASNINGVISGYKSQQFRLHCPAENYLDGSQADIEMQFYHVLNSDVQQTSTGSTIMEYAIVSLMFKLDTTATTTFFSSYDVTKGGLSTDPTLASISINLATTFQAQLLDLSGQYYLYQGSQTFPDCSENVNWYVYSQVLPITQAQLTSVQSFFSGELKFAGGKGNNRALQSVNGRTIKKGNIQCEEQFIHFFSFFVIYTFLNFFVCKML